jgi:RNA polymerase sigma factor (TIGR02999 family)
LAAFETGSKAMAHTAPSPESQGESGDADLGNLFRRTYQELHALAEAYMRQERPDHTLRPTALIHEAFLRLEPQGGLDWRSRSQFLAVAAKAMRRILVDHARTHRRKKRSGTKRKRLLSDSMLVDEHRNIDLLGLDEALEALAVIEPEHARVVELRFFGGCSIDETAGILGMSRSGVVRAWRSAQAWLFHRLSQGDTRVEQGPDP